MERLSVDAHPAQGTDHRVLKCRDGVLSQFDDQLQKCQAKLRLFGGTGQPDMPQAHLSEKK